MTMRPVAGICVLARNNTEVWVPNHGYMGYGGETRPIDGPVTTSSAGTYEIAELPSGDWTIQFGGCGHRPHPAYVTQYFDRAEQPAEAAKVIVGPAGIHVIPRAPAMNNLEEQQGWLLQNVDAEMVKRSGFAGKVTNQSGEPLGGVCVTSHSRAASLTVTTAADGTYLLPGPDNFAKDGSPLYLEFFPCREDFSFQEGSWRHQYWYLADTHDQARVIKFRQGDWLFGFDAILRPAAGQHEGLAGERAGADGAALVGRADAV